MRYRPIPETEPHTFTHLLFPAEEGDWGCCYREVVESYLELITAIAQFEPVLVTYPAGKPVPTPLARLAAKYPNQIHLRPGRYNDTWVRDSGGIPVESQGRKGVLDFKFNGWGLKYPANFDNRLTRDHFPEAVLESFNFVLEGGAIEVTDRYLLTTENCQLEQNRNYPLSKQQITDFLRELFGLEVLWVTGQPLAGDDTDGHIDTLARFIGPNRIAYLQPTPGSPNFPQLTQLEGELHRLAEEYRLELIPVPEPSPHYWEGRQLPATYLNFYWVNGGVILPTYSCSTDREVVQLFRQLLPDRQIVPVDSSIFIRQNGSVHCLTRDYHHPL